MFTYLFRCGDTWECTHFRFQNASKMCILKLAADNEKIAGAFYNLTTDDISGNRACGCVRHINMNYQGNEFKQETKQNATDCADWCVSYFFIYMFHFYITVLSPLFQGTK